MLRKFLAVLAIAFAGLLVMAGTAAAVPDGDYGATGSSVNVTEDTVGVGATTNFFGSGFLGGETIDITVTYLGPNGLRRSAALAERAAGFSGTTIARSDGTFSIELVMEEPGLALLTAVGQTSGVTGSMNVQVGDGSGGGSGGGAGNGGTGYANTGDGNTGYGSGSGDGTANGTDNGTGGLAYTGASVVGPIAIGVIALLAGFTLLFFGTRGAMRRKAPKPGS